MKQEDTQNLIHVNNYLNDRLLCLTRKINIELMSEKTIFHGEIE